MARMPTFSAARRLFRTYTAEAGSLPTRTTASPGGALPASTRALTRPASESSRSSAMRLPSRIRAAGGAVVMRGPPDLCWSAAAHYCRPVVASRHPDWKAPTSTEDFETTQIQAAAFRRLVPHLVHERPDVQRGIGMSKDEAREAIYGETFARWKDKHQREATAEQLAAFVAAQRKGVQP